MDRKLGFFKRHKKPVIFIAIAIVVATAGLFVYFRLGAAQNTGIEIPQTIVLTKTSLESKVTASGNFASVEPVTIGSNVQGGEVETVYVQAGDRVEAGDVLAKLKTSDIQRSISDTKDSISEAAKSDQQKLESAQRAVNDADAQYRVNLEQNNQAVANAQAKADAANATRDAALAAAQADPQNSDLQQAYAKAQEAAVTAQEACDKAVQQRDSTTRSDSSKLSDAWAQHNALVGQDSTKKSRTELESLNEDLSNASIVSAISGIVTKVSTEAGKAASGDMFTVENTESLMISASVAEYDIIKIERGMSAHITSNATGEQSYDGVVDFVAPVASDTSGNFEVKVLLTSAAGELKPGMTATVEIVTKSKQDVFAVPIDAVVTRPDGKTVVYAYEISGGFIANGPSSRGIGETPSPGQTEGEYTTAGGMRQPPANGTGQVPTPGSGETPIRVTNGTNGTSGANGTNAAVSGERREIEVTTGMETDYYIEISGSGLAEGLLILSDPQGKNVQSSGDGMMTGPNAGFSIGGTAPRGGGERVVRGG